MLYFFCFASVISSSKFWILEIHYFFAASYPTFIRKTNITFIRNFGVHQRPHTLLVLTGFIVDIGNVESVGFVLDRVSDFEIEPLSVVFWICIFVKDQIVLIFSNSVGLIQITTLKSTFEDEGFILVVFQLMIVGQVTEVPILLLIWSRKLSRIVYSKVLIFFRINYLGVDVY